MNSKNFYYSRAIISEKTELMRIVVFHSSDLEVIRNNQTDGRKKRQTLDWKVFTPVPLP